MATAEAGFLEQLESLQSVHGVMRQFKFEGGTAADRQKDSGGQPSDLLAGAGEGGTGANDVNMTPMDTTDDVPWSYPAGDVNAIGYEAGFDGAGVSQAYRPQSTPVTSTFAAEALSQRRSGAGLYTTFSTPTMMTIEAVIKPDLYVDSGNGPHYLFQTRPGTGRGYYLSQVAPTGSRGVGGSVTAIVGSDFSERPALLQDYVDPSHWYYVAATFDLSGGATGFAVVDSYYADLTAGGPLVQSQNDYTFAATIGATLVNTSGLAGVGMFVRPGATVLGQEFYFGSMDNMAIYQEKLTDAQIQHHFRALTVVGVPEPASLVLLGLAGLACAVIRRRVA